MTKIYFLLFSLAVFFAGCKSASKAFNKGNYNNAVELGVKKLAKDPDDRETKDLVKTAYTYAVNLGEENIRNYSNTANENRYELILQEYSRLQDLYQVIQQYPAVAQWLKPANYNEYVTTYRNKAAEIHIENGDKWMDDGNKRSYRQAYNEYQSALRLVNNTDTKRRRDEAYNAALTKVLVVPIQNYGGYGYNTSYQLQQFQNDIMRTLAQNMNNEFVKFYSEWDLRVKDFEPDQILEINLGTVRIGRPYDKQTTREVSKEVVIKEIVYKPDSVVKQYATVRGKITKVERTSVSQGELYLSLRDTKGRTLWNDRFTGEHRWQTTFATYSGDERALSESDRSLLNQNNNRNMPAEEEIMGELFRKIQSDLSYRLRNYFERY